MKTNDEQQAAIDDCSEQLLIVAGPGSGKTFTLVSRMADKLQRLDPAGVVAITYTNAAAKELQSRLPAGPPLGYCGTLHGFCLNLLNKFGGFNGATVMDAEEEAAFLDKVRRDVAPRATLKDCKTVIDLGPNILTQHQRQTWTHAELVAFSFYDFMRQHNVLTFDAILWFARNVLLQWGTEPWPWEQLFVDEFQDAAPLDAELYAVMPFAQKTFVGDPDQCQPAGTQVSMSDGTVKPIELIEPGDAVLTYARHEKMFIKSGKVTASARRPFSGTIYKVHAGSKHTSTTGNHKWLVKWKSGAERTADNWCVYLMRLGDFFRVGKSRFFRSGSGKGDLLGLAVRMKQERADAGWVLSIHSTDAEATAREAIVAASYGLPQTCFRSGGQTQEVVDAIFEGVPDQLRNAMNCLRAHNREMSFPLFHKGQARTRRTVQEIEACNLLDDVMSVPTSEGYDSRNRYGTWTPVKVTTQWFIGDVFSLDVATHHKYVADGIVTCNSIYGFRGASVAPILKLSHQFGVRTLTLARNYRSKAEIADLAGALIKLNRRRIPKDCVADAAGGEVEAWLNLPSDAAEYGAIADRLAKLPEGKTAAVLVRTNFLVEAVTAALEARGIAVATRRKVPLPADWSAAQKLVALLAAPGNDFLACRYIEAVRGPAEAEAARLKALSLFTTVNEVYLHLPADLPLAVVPQYLARFGISRASQDLVAKAAANMPSGAGPAELAVEMRSDLLPVRTDNAAAPVTVTTLHGAKGREWDCVFIAGADADLLPLKNADLEEERRLLFVGITRAKEQLVISTAQQRRAQKWQRAAVPAQPSLFFADMGFKG